MKQYSQIILASGSPRRKGLLEQAGLTFQVLPAQIDEKAIREKAGSPEELVKRLSRLKAENVLQKVQADPALIQNEGRERHFAPPLVLGADTAVSIGKEILGKPESPEDAMRMLMKLSGKTHQVFTGVTVIPVTDQAEPICFAEKTDVEMLPFTKKEAEAYVRTGEPMDKAGAYGIQGKGALLVKQIRGDFFSVVGLPLPRLIWQLSLAGYLDLEGGDFY